MDTDRGGFYINSGHLQFKKLPTKAPKVIRIVQARKFYKKSPIFIFLYQMRNDSNNCCVFSVL